MEMDKRKDEKEDIQELYLSSELKKLRQISMEEKKISTKELEFEKSEKIEIDVREDKQKESKELKQELEKMRKEVMSERISSTRDLSIEDLLKREGSSSVFNVPSPETDLSAGEDGKKQEGFLLSEKTIHELLNGKDISLPEDVPLPAIKEEESYRSEPEKKQKKLFVPRIPADEAVKAKAISPPETVLSHVIKKAESHSPETEKKQKDFSYDPVPDFANIEAGEEEKDFKVELEKFRKEVISERTLSTTEFPIEKSSLPEEISEKAKEEELKAELSKLRKEVISERVSNTRDLTLEDLTGGTGGI